MFRMHIFEIDSAMLVNNPQLFSNAKTLLLVIG